MPAPFKYFLILATVVFCLLNATRAFAQNQDSLAVDSSHIEIRTTDRQAFKDITNEKVFEYNQQAQNPESLLSRFRRWLLQQVLYLFENRWASIFIKLTFYALFALALIGLINQILGGNMSSAFSNKQARKGLGIQAEEGKLAQTDFEQLLNEAISARRFHDAVRFLYLKSLEELSSRELIELKHDKTNHDYLKELGPHPASPLFSRLTLFYEYVEYGDFSIGENGFSKIRKVYEEFKKNISGK